MGHVPTEDNCSDIFTKNTAMEVFIKHARNINNGNIKCFINHLGPTYTREDVDNNESWTVVTKKKSHSKPSKVSWSASVKQHERESRAKPKKF